MCCTIRIVFAVTLVGFLNVLGCNKSPNHDGGPTGGIGANTLKSIHLPMRTDGPKSFDPIRGSTVYDNRASCLVYETLVQYKYLVRPAALEPLLLTEMPKVLDNGMRYSFKLRRDVMFADDPCFPNGKGRTIVSKDVFYSWKRMANNQNAPKAWWLFENTIAGFDAYRKTQNDAVKQGGTFDYDAPVSGMKIISDTEFEVILTEPVQRFMWVLAMFQLSIVPREAVEKYDTRFGRHPVGTGPFLLKQENDWVPGKRMVLHRNPTYHKDYYPTEHMPEDVALGLTLAAGQRLPIVDRVIYTMYVEDQPMWLEFQAKKIGYTQTPDEYFDEAFHRRSKKLKNKFVAQGVTSFTAPLLDFIFRGFNMEDKVLGGYTPKKRALRQAISLALDWHEQNDTFYHGLNIIYDGPIPPMLDGYPQQGRAPVSYRGPDIQRAKALLKKAGLGNTPLEIPYYTNQGGNSVEQAEMTTRQLKKIGIVLKPNLVDFSTLIEAVNNKKAPFFSFAWGSDYPDAENNLALFYGPNASPGSNHFNYKNKAYDLLYEKIRSMKPGQERTAIYETMRDMVIEDAPFAGSMARTRHYLINPWLKNFKPSEHFYNWVKYLDVDASKR